MKKNLKKVLAFAACAVLSIGMLQGCGGSSGGSGGSGASGSAAGSGAASSGDVTLRYVVHGPDTMTVFTCDPAVDYTGQMNQGMGVCETLMVLDDETKEVKPLLAEEWKQTDDNTWTFKIRSGVKFSNGKDLTAEMVKKAFDYILSKNERLSK
ncbi:MAG: hypothetical protein IK054_05560, partial [Lachnospiraceae bacterium]|nr:hypothetical protein [Lachnospiraceae bacterium]